MTDLENYCFDVFGYLVIRNVLTTQEVRACVDGLEGEKERILSSSAQEAFIRLRDHPVLAGYLDELVAGESHLLGEPRVIGHNERMDTGQLVGGNEPRDPSRMYYQQNTVRFCQGIFALWALSDAGPGDGGLALVPASHKSYAEPPRKLMTREDDMGVVCQPELKAGDLVLCVASILHGFRASQAKLLMYEYASETVQRHPQHKWGEWIEELTPLQRALVAPEGHPLPSIFSDGQICRFEEGPGIIHPSIYSQNVDCGIDPQEFYLWDLCGHVVIKHIMDEKWLADANEAIDACADRIVVGGSAAKGSAVLAGTGVPSLYGIFELPGPHCNPFREMIAHASVIQRLNWMMGSGFRCRDARAICSVNGTSGHGLHSGSEPARPKNTYSLQNGRVYCDSINVAWQLRDVLESDGGFMCIPGSHKARYPVPPELIVCEEAMHMIRHVDMDAGDVAMFLGAAQTHGALPWKNDVSRRAVLLGYSSRYIS